MNRKTLALAGSLALLAAGCGPSPVNVPAIIEPAVPPAAKAPARPVLTDSEPLPAYFAHARTLSAADYAQDIPLRVIARMLGFPETDAEMFRTFIRLVIDNVDASAEERQAQIDSG